MANPLQYSYLENPMDRGAWWVPVLGIAKSWTQPKQFSMHKSLKSTPNYSKSTPNCLASPKIHANSCYQIVPFKTTNEPYVVKSKWSAITLHLDGYQHLDTTESLPSLNFFKNIYLLVWLLWVSVAACGISSCGMPA